MTGHVMRQADWIKLSLKRKIESKPGKTKKKGPRWHQPRKTLQIVKKMVLERKTQTSR